MKKKMILLSTCLLILQACGENTAENHPYDQISLIPGIGSSADIATTAVGLEKGYTEGNPLISPFGDAAPLAGIPIKYGAKKFIVAMGSTPARANVTVESTGAGAACANALTISGAAPPAAIAAFITCTVATRHLMKQKYLRDTGHDIDWVKVDEDVARERYQNAGGKDVYIPVIVPPARHQSVIPDSIAYNPE